MGPPAKLNKNRSAAHETQGGPKKWEVWLRASTFAKAPSGAARDMPARQGTTIPRQPRKNPVLTIPSSGIIPGIYGTGGWVQELEEVLQPRDSLLSLENSTSIGDEDQYPPHCSNSSLPIRIIHGSSGIASRDLICVPAPDASDRSEKKPTRSRVHSLPETSALVK